MFEDISKEPEESAYDEIRAAYLKAIQQEMKDMNKDATAREVAKNTRNLIVEAIPESFATMRALSIGAASESVRYNASKWILENALLPDKAGSKDVMAELLEEMAELDQVNDE